MPSTSSQQILRTTGARARRARGFTFLELLVVSILMVPVTIMATQFWTSFSRTLVDMAGRTVTARELRLILSGLAQDFGACVGATSVGEDDLVLCTDAGQYPNGVADWEPPDVVIEYYLSGGHLRRFDRSTGCDIALADNVSKLLVEELTDSVVQVTIEVRHGDVAPGDHPALEQAVKSLRRQMGYTLGGTMVFLVLAALLWEGVVFQMAGYLRMEKALSQQQSGRQGCTRAAAWALALLETGVPPDDPYVCQMSPMQDSAKVYVATFRDEGGLRYAVSIRLATVADETLPTAPVSFEKAKK